MPPYTTVIAAQFDQIAGSTLGERERSPLISLALVFFSHLSDRAPRFIPERCTDALFFFFSKLRFVVMHRGELRDSTDSSTIGANNVMSEAILKRARLSRSVAFAFYCSYF